jgi:hypothetical protein
MHSWQQWWGTALVFLLLICLKTEALDFTVEQLPLQTPVPPVAGRMADSDSLHEQGNAELRRASHLRIMPLGASITAGLIAGVGLTNGYRKPLLDRLVKDGWKVNMVGTQSSGTMTERVRLVTFRTSSYYYLTRIPEPRRIPRYSYSRTERQDSGRTHHRKVPRERNPIERWDQRLLRPHQPSGSRPRYSSPDTHPAGTRG